MTLILIKLSKNIEYNVVNKINEIFLMKYFVINEILFWENEIKS